MVELVPLGRFAQREYRKAWLAALSAATEAWYRANEADDAAQTAANVAAELQAEVLALASSATAAEARAAQAGVERDAAETRAAELERALEAEERVTSQITLEYNAKLKALAASEAENFELKLTLVALGKQLRDAGLVPCVETGNDGDETGAGAGASTCSAAEASVDDDDDMTWLDETLGLAPVAGVTDSSGAEEDTEWLDVFLVSGALANGQRKTRPS